MMTLLWSAMPVTVSVALMAGWVLFGGILLFAPSPRVEAFLSGGICVGPRWAGGVCPGRTAPVFPRVGIVALAWCAGIYALLSGAVFLVLAFCLHRQMKPSGHRSVPEVAHERVRQEAIQAQVSSDPQPLGKHASGRSERDA